MNQEYETRRQSFIHYLKEADIGAAMVTDPANIFYLTGFNTDPHERFLALYVDRPSEEIYFFVPALDKEIAEEMTSIEHIIPIADIDDPSMVVKQTIQAIPSKIGMEKKSVSILMLEHLRQTLGHFELTDIQPLLTTLRMTKSDKEITLAKEAIHIIEHVMTEGIKRIKRNISEIELVAELEYLMRKYGAEKPSFDTLVLFGEKAALPHGKPDTKKLKDGDFILIDMGVLKNGYCSDITRTFIYGEPTPKQKEIYHTVLQSNLAGIHAIKKGVPVKNFDIASRTIINNAGYGDYFITRVGHGLGIELHEEPSIHGENEMLAKNGMLFTIEPGIYIPDFGGVRIEDTVYINEQGQPEVLSTFPKELKLLK